MAINLEKLQASPARPKEDKPLPIATETNMRRIIGSKIQRVLDRAQGPIKIPTYIYIDPQFLFEIMGENQISFFHGFKNERIGRVEHEKLQRIGISVMADYGFNPNRINSDNLELKNNGVTFQNTFYRSELDPGLIFERKYYFMTDTKAPTSVHWWAHDISETRLNLAGAVLGLIFRKPSKK